MRSLLMLIVGVLLCGCASSVDGDEETVKSGPDAKLPPELGTRKAGVDWPRFLGPTGDSVSLEKGIVWPKDGPRVLWHMKVAEGYGMPTISRGRLFLLDQLRTIVRLRCLKSETGEQLWRFEYESDYEDKYGYSNGPRCSPVVDGERVYIFGAEGMLHCLRVTDGKPIWKLDSKKEFGVVQNFFGVGSTPVIEGDLLLTMIGGSPAGSDKVDFSELQSNGTALVTFDKYTGKVKYKVGDDLAAYAAPVLATIDKRRWCFVFARSGLLGLDPTTGKLDFHYHWRARDLESVNAATPIVIGNRVLISETYGVGSALLEVKPGSCKEVWTDKDKGRGKSLMCHWNTPIHVDGYVYGCSGRHTNEAELRCVELATGKVMWSEPGMTRTSLLLIDGHFLCLAEDGVLRLLKVNPKKYEEVAQVELRPPDKDGKPDARARPVASAGGFHHRPPESGR